MYTDKNGNCLILVRVAWKYPDNTYAIDNIYQEYRT